MSKAEERALEVFPLEIDGDSRGSYDSNVVKRIVYQQGYEQAEKDMELTVDDICEIMEIREDVLEMDSYENLYEEILKRYKERKDGCKE